MEITIDSRSLKRTITFSRPGSHYIRVDLNDGVGMLGQQICGGGHLVGSTIMYSGDDRAHFERLCRNWWRSYLRNTAYSREV